MDRSEYQEAIKQFDEALRLKPGDLATTEMRKDAEIRLHLREMRTSLQRGSYARASEAAEAALKSGAHQQEAAVVRPMATEPTITEAVFRKKYQQAEQYFKDATSSTPQGELFDTHTWQVSADFDTARAALLRSFDRSPDKWSVVKETKAGDRLSLFELKAKGILSDGGRFGFIQVCEVAQDATEIRCKIWLYTNNKWLFNSRSTKGANPSFRISSAFPTRS